MVKHFITSDNKFLWNLTANVGRGMPNNLDDVELVRYGYFCVALSLKRSTAADIIPVIPLIDKMKTIGPYGPDLQAVIDQDQDELGITPDGHISALRTAFSSAAQPRERNVLYRIISLNGFMSDRSGASWPRFDQFNESGPTISKFLKDFFFSGFGR